MPTRILQNYCLAAFLWLSAVSLSAQDNPFNQRVTLDFRGNSLAEAFAKIEQATSLSFTYSAQHLPNRQLALRFKGERLKKVLKEILGDTGLNYTLSGNHIVVFLDREDKEEKPPQFTLSGYIRDAHSGEELIGGYIFIEELSAGTASNAYGFYSLTLPGGQYRLQARYLGYVEKDTVLALQNNRTVGLSLEPGVQQLAPIIISANVSNGLDNQKSPASGTAIEMDLINEMPGLLGEQDILQSLQLLPGVSSSGDAVSAISVRGGASDQNLYLMDEAPVFYDAHMSGFVSVFNPDAVKHVSLYKNHIPAKYQGRLASVIDVRTAEGNDERLGASGGIGIIASRLKVEGPLLKNRATFLVAARRSHLELYSSLFKSTDLAKGVRNAFSFSDLNAKTSLRLGPKSRVFLSGYYGQDTNETSFVGRVPVTSSNTPWGIGLGWSTRTRTQWGNKTLTLRWNYLFSKRLFQNTSVIYHDFQYQFRESTQDSAFIGLLGLRPKETQIKGLQVKTDFQYYQAPGSVFKFGAGVYFSRFGHLRADMPVTARPDDAIQRRSVTAGLYAAHEWELQERIAIDYGLHFTQFSALGTGSFIYEYNQQEARIDSTYYAPGQPIQHYYGFEPRVSVSYALGETQWLTLVYNRNYQYVQRISRPIPDDPVNIWLPSSRLIKPQYSNHWSLEYKAGIGKGAYEATLGLYYKSMGNQPGFRSGATLDGPPADLESLLVFGKIEAKGFECLLRKNKGQFRAWASYTFSAAEARFDQIEGGQPFPTDVLRPHVLSLAAVWDVNDKMAVVGRWVYLSGKRLTIPVGKYAIDGVGLDYYAPRNAYRLEDNHRFDLSITVYRKGVRDRGTSLNVSLINLYFRKNPSYVYIRHGLDGTSKVYQVSLTPFIIPSITYNFRF